MSQICILSIPYPNSSERKDIHIFPSLPENITYEKITKMYIDQKFRHVYKDNVFWSRLSRIAKDEDDEITSVRIRMHLERDEYLLFPIKNITEIDIVCKKYVYCLSQNDMKKIISYCSIF